MKKTITTITTTYFGHSVVKTYEKVASCSGRKIKRLSLPVIAALIGLGFTSCASEAGNYSEDWSNAVRQVEQAKTRDKIEITQAVLRVAYKDGILDEGGKKCYHALLIANNASLAAYMELVEECEREESFYDTVGGTDEWEKYVTVVLNK